MKKILIGGVPEHFNLPWYIGLKDKKFQEKDINLRWKDFPGGTGEMAQALRDKEIDMAVILTEGIVRDIINGNPSSIVQVFVESPLLWGIHVAADSQYQSIPDLKGTAAAISRYGSGSHLMAFVNAENHDWNLQEDLLFKEIKDLEGALEGLPKGIGDYFMWEKFMTKPYVDDGTFRLIGESPTPWPSFVVVARNEVIKENEETIKTILEVINEITRNFKNIPGIAELIAKRYGQELPDVREWLELTHWSQRPMKEEVLEKVQDELLKLELIDRKLLSNKLLHPIT
ncbi:ABC transporter substrate-binding protein [Aequorivita sp. H23M31]|uniref:ABC transporter substrate-binding protein n=1 Tax=Aequorivita ciconiae TaxID=2494375 RepID=A0A410G107_9FLAO|nr:substrate-binding domain-containing protein [Aequorivita sp. H23M31]QAA80947.1 ABC transporter substrate-binding protein [Aequorivita sp. H23M31]